ncbi:hypothetical protein pipiens_019964 [Culex pipiens pipiens]|uniref:Uncharacterized protein n=1 Tax=Culex pipiens pipiens TaxID=38569 RepID=A0ABD1DQT9_CULPP
MECSRCRLSRSEAVEGKVHGLAGRCGRSGTATWSDQLFWIPPEADNNFNPDYRGRKRINTDVASSPSCSSGVCGDSQRPIGDPERNGRELQCGSKSMTTCS